MKNKTHIGKVYRCIDYRRQLGLGEFNKKLHETANYWIDDDSRRFSKKDGYANMNWWLDLNSVKPIEDKNEKD